MINKISWKSILDSTSDEDIRDKLKDVVDKFFKPDKVDPHKFMANYQILKHNSREIYKSSARLTGEPDLSKEGTKSIDNFASVLNRPVGYEDWFIAAYPDVVAWFNDVDDDKVIKILDNPSESDMINKENKIRNEILRKIVNAYPNKIECAK